MDRLSYHPVRCRDAWDQLRSWLFASAGRCDAVCTRHHLDLCGFRHAAPRAAVIQAALNLIAVVFYVRGVTHLLEIQPNVHGFVVNYLVAQVLMSLAIFYMARCLQLDARFPRWIDWVFYLYGVASIGQTMFHITGIPIRPFDPPVIAVTLAVELCYAFLMIKVGARQLNEQEDLLRN